MRAPSIARCWAVALLAASVPAILGAATTRADQAGAATTTNPARAWIDDPLDGALVVPGSLTVVAHATDPAGVTGIGLTVDDKPGTASPFDGTTTLATARLGLELVEGDHVLVVHGSGPGGTSASNLVHLRVRTEPKADASDTLPNTSEPGGSTSTTTSPLAGQTSTTSVPTSNSSTTTATTSTTNTIPSTTSTTTCSTAKPTSLTPNGTTAYLISVQLSWQFPAACPHDQFIVQVSRDATFVRLDGQAIVPGSQFTWTATLSCPTTAWYWRVATATSGISVVPGPWSTTATITLNCGRTR